MRDFLMRLLINAVALAATAAILPGISVRDNGIGTLLIVALIFGLLNAVLKPALLILSCPLVILTLGLFLLVVNGLMLILTDALVGDRFEVDGLLWAIVGGIAISIIASILENVLGVKDEDKDEPYIIRSDR